MSQVDEAVLDLTVAEASLLADVLGVAPPPGMVDPDDDTPVSTETAVVAPGLIERRLLDGEGTVSAAVADVLTVVGSPHLKARALHEVGGVIEVRSYLARPEMAVEQRHLDTGTLRFTPFDPNDLVDRMMAFVAPGVDLDGEAGGPSDAMRSFPCPSVTIDRIFAGADAHSVVTELVSTGVDEADARAFVEAAAAIESTSSVMVFHRPSKDEILGVELTWMDAGNLGIWLTEPAKEPAVRILEQVSVGMLATRLSDFLPLG